MVAHEIETHVLTAENGSHQPYELLRRGTANYLDTQEGMAIVNQNRTLSPHHEKRLGAARSLLGVAYALEHSFSDTLAYLEQELGYRPEKALAKAFAKQGKTGNAAALRTYARNLRTTQALASVQTPAANATPEGATAH